MVEFQVSVTPPRRGSTVGDYTPEAWLRSSELPPAFESSGLTSLTAEEQAQLMLDPMQKEEDRTIVEYHERVFKMLPEVCFFLLGLNVAFGVGVKSFGADMFVLKKRTTCRRLMACGVGHCSCLRLNVAFASGVPVASYLESYRFMHCSKHRNSHFRFTLDCTYHITWPDTWKLHLRKAFSLPKSFITCFLSNADKENPFRTVPRYQFSCLPNQDFPSWKSFLTTI